MWDPEGGRHEVKAAELPVVFAMRAEQAAVRAVLELDDDLLHPVSGYSGRASADFHHGLLARRRTGGDLPPFGRDL